MLLLLWLQLISCLCFSTWNSVRSINWHSCVCVSLRSPSYAPYKSINKLMPDPFISTSDRVVYRFDAYTHAFSFISLVFLPSSSSSWIFQPPLIVVNDVTAQMGSGISVYCYGLNFFSLFGLFVSLIYSFCYYFSANFLPVSHRYGVHEASAHSEKANISDEINFCDSVHVAA